MNEKVRKLLAKLYDTVKANSERRFYSLYDKVQRMGVLEEA